MRKVGAQRKRNSSSFLDLMDKLINTLGFHLRADTTDIDQRHFTGLPLLQIISIMVKGRGKQSMFETK